MNVMTDQQRQSVTDTALIELLTETSHWEHNVGADGLSMEAFLKGCLDHELIPTEDGKWESVQSLLPGGEFNMEEACKLYAYSNGDNNTLKILCTAYLQNDSFRNTTIMDVDQSNGAVVTRNAATNTYTVAFCGTRGDYLEWPDNAEGLLNESSRAQRNAANYFDTVSSRFEEGANVVVTGHSKGGNKAQYVTMFSENRSVIDSCVALDGQGFSKQAMEAMQIHEDYSTQRNKITLVCGSDDYVHVLGERLAREDQTYYIQGGHRFAHDGTDAFTRDHYVQYMFQNSGGTFTCELNAASEQGEFSKAIERLYKEIDHSLDPQAFAFVARTAMKLIDGTATVEEKCQLADELGPHLSQVLLHTPEGQAYLATIPQETISNQNMQGFLGGAEILRGLTFGYVTSSVIAELAPFFGVLTDAYGSVKDSLYTNLGIGSSPYSSSGASIASESTELRVDTDALWDCATDLSRLQDRVTTLSSRIRNAFDGRRGNESGLEIVLGGLVDIMFTDRKEHMQNACSILSKAADGMKTVADALCLMAPRLESAEQTAAKHGGREV